LENIMKITSVKTYHLKHQLPRAVGCSTLLYSERDALLVRIATDEGLVGWGETAPLGGVRGLIDDQLAAILIGQDPREHRKLWRQLWGPNFGNGLAVGAVDTALHDLRGKALGLSIAELYGGRLRDRVPVYASALNYTEGVEPEKQYPEEAARLVARGFRALKMRIGRFEPRRDLAVVAAVRAAVGPDVKLMADGNGAYTLPTAVRVGRELERLGLAWFEEPLPEAPNYAGYEELRQKLDIALAGGEVLDSRGAARELLCRGAFDIIQPDVSLCGGIGECLFVAEMARLWGVQCNPHCWAGAIAIAATLHVLALLPDATWGHSAETPMLELDLIENPFRDKLVTRPLQVKADGFIDVPRGPGLGIEVDEDAVKHYQCG
jgi:D-galactarolactone cycloisomerase